MVNFLYIYSGELRIFPNLQVLINKVVVFCKKTHNEPLNKNQLHFLIPITPPYLDKNIYLPSNFFLFTNFQRCSDWGVGFYRIYKKNNSLKSGPYLANSSIQLNRYRHLLITSQVYQVKYSIMQDYGYTCLFPLFLSKHDNQQALVDMHIQALQQ